MSATTHIRQPSTTTSTLPRASHRPLPSSSSSVNISSSHPQLTSNDTPSVSQHKDEFKIPTARSTTAGGARKVSGKQLGPLSNSSRVNESGSIGSVSGPRRILQGVQESTSEQRGLRDSSKSIGAITTLPRSQSSSIRPPTSSRAPLRPATTPLRRSQLSQSISRSTLDEKDDPSAKSKPPSRDEGNAASALNTSRSRPTSTAPPSRRAVSGTPNRKGVVQESTASPRTRRVPPSPSTTASTSRKPSSSSLLNRSVTSANLSRSTSSRTSLQPEDSPLKRSTTTARLLPASSAASIRPPRPPLSRLPTSTSTVSKLSSASSSIPQSSSRQLGSNRLQRNESSERLKGFGPPPVARRVSVSRSTRGINTGNGGTPRNRKKEGKEEEESRILRERRESWETVGSSTTRSARPSLEPSTISSTCEERTNPFSTPSTPSSTKPLSSSSSTHQTLLDPTPRQISLLRSSSTHKRKPRGSTTLEELLASGLFSSPLPNSLPTSSSTGGGGMGGNNFELMDEEVSRVMLEEIGGLGSPWRGRVVSLNMSKGRSPRREQHERDVSFEPDAEEEEEEEQAERREVLVLERTGEADELRREKEELGERLRVIEEEKEKELRELREGLESESRRQKEEWEREKKEFERNLAELENSRPKETNQLDLRLLEATTSYRIVETSCEGIAASATRERDELIGMMESLKVIGKGLEVWRSIYWANL